VATTVISISGVQGTGKTTLARALAIRLDACLVSRDPLMAVLLEGGVPMAGLKKPTIKHVGLLGYELQSTVLREQLKLGRSVVLECVAPPDIRDGWREIAVAAGAPFFAVETECTDPDLHRSRFESRGTAQVGDWHLRWANVEGTRKWYQPHADAVFVADSVHPLETNVEEVLRLIAR
jgi:predicted kinase